MAPMANSRCPGTPSFRTTKISSGACECPRHLVGHRHAASWQAEHHYVGIVRVTRKPRGQLDARILRDLEKLGPSLTASVS